MSFLVVNPDDLCYADIAECVPVRFDLPYIREELDGYCSLLGNDGDPNYTMLNKTGYQVLKMCNGSMTVADILSSAEKSYPTVKQEVLEGDITRILFKLSSIRAIGWIEGDHMKAKHPFFDDEKVPLGDGYSICLAKETDLSILTTFIDHLGENINSGYEYVEYHWDPWIRNYGDSVETRRRLFNYSYEYFLIHRSGSLVGVLEIEPALDLSLNFATIKFLALPWQVFPSVINSVVDFYSTFPYKRVNSIHLMMPRLMSLENSRLMEMLPQVGFNLMTRLKGEYGEGDDLLVYCLGMGLI